MYTATNYGRWWSRVHNGSHRACLSGLTARWYSERAIGAAAAARPGHSSGAGRQEREAIEPPLPDDVFPGTLHSLYVSVYLNGRLRGCAGSEVTEPDRDIRMLVRGRIARTAGSRRQRPG